MYLVCTFLFVFFHVCNGIANRLSRNCYSEFFQLESQTDKLTRITFH